MRLHRSEGGGRISVQYQNALTEPIKMELSEKKNKLNFREDIIVNDFLPSTFFLRLIALNYFPQRTQGFSTPAPRGMDQGNCNCPLSFQEALSETSAKLHVSRRCGQPRRLR